MEVSVLLNADSEASVGFHPRTAALAERFTFVGIDASTAEDAAEIAWSLTNRDAHGVAGGVDLLDPGLTAQADAYRAADHRALAFGDVVIVMDGMGQSTQVALAREHDGWRRLNRVPVHVQGLPPGMSLVSCLRPWVFDRPADRDG